MLFSEIKVVVISKFWFSPRHHYIPHWNYSRFKGLQKKWGGQGRPSHPSPVLHQDWAFDVLQKKKQQHFMWGLYTAIRRSHTRFGARGSYITKSVNKGGPHIALTTPRRVGASNSYLLAVAAIWQHTEPHDLRFAAPSRGDSRRSYASLPSTPLAILLVL